MCFREQRASAQCVCLCAEGVVRYQSQLSLVLSSCYARLLGCTDGGMHASYTLSLCRLSRLSLSSQQVGCQLVVAISTRYLQSCAT